MTDILPQTQNEEAFDLLGQSENIAVSHVAESEINSAVEPRQNTSPQASKKRNIVQQVDLNSTRELSDPITNELRSPQTVQTSPRKVDNQDEDGFFDDLHAQIVKNMRESRIQEVQNRPAPGPYISDNLFTSSYFYPASSSMAYSSLRGAITPTANIANSVYLTKSASSGVYAKPVSLQTSPKGFGDLLVKINQTLRTSNPTKYADDVKVSYRIPTEYTSNLSVRQNTGGYDKNKFDQILAKIVRTSYNNKPNPASILRTSTGPTYEKVLPKNISQQEVRFSVQSEERESVKKAQAPKKKHRTVTRNLQNDEDSMYVERNPERIEEEEEIVEERVRREPVVVHHEEKPKKLTKRQEIINEKKSLRSSSQHMKSTGEMRQSRLTLNNDKLAEKRFGTEFILSPKKISATHYVSFGSQKGRGSSTMAGKVFNDNAN